MCVNHVLINLWKRQLYYPAAKKSKWTEIILTVFVSALITDAGITWLYFFHLLLTRKIFFFSLSVGDKCFRGKVRRKIERKSGCCVCVSVDVCKRERGGERGSWEQLVYNNKYDLWPHSGDDSKTKWRLSDPNPSISLCLSICPFLFVLLVFLFCVSLSFCYGVCPPVSFLLSFSFCLFVFPLCHTDFCFKSPSLYFYLLRSIF